MKSYLKTSDHFLSKETYELLHDEELDMLITHPKPLDISKYYESDNYISHNDRTNNVIDRLYHWVKRVNSRNKLRLVARMSKAGRKLLDVGAGTGDFLLYAKKKGWKVSGVEPNLNANLLASKKGIQLKTALAEFGNERFDVITLWHVLEHLPNLKESIGILCNMLKDNGALIIAVPNFKSYDAHHYHTFWAAYDVPRHLWHFSKKSIEKLFEAHKMQLMERRPMWFDSFYVSLLSEEYKTGKKNWVKSFGIGLWSNIKGVYTKEYSSHIYILKKQK
ncbi:MAG: class I SAM-dependent methyltransferase [Bacteroidota bacterium]